MENLPNSEYFFLFVWLCSDPFVANGEQKMSGTVFGRGSELWSKNNFAT